MIAELDIKLKYDDGSGFLLFDNAGEYIRLLVDSNDNRTLTKYDDLADALESARAALAVDRTDLAAIYGLSADELSAEGMLLK